MRVDRVRPQPVQWLSAGYFLIVPGTPPSDLADLLPERIFTVSDCISEVVPHPDTLSRSRVATDSGLDLPTQTTLGFEDLIAWAGRAVDAGELGWPNTFLSLRAAREFRRRFTDPTGNTRLIGLGLTPEVAAEYVDGERIEGKDAGNGGWSLLRDSVPLDPSGTCLGFDVLGVEGWGSFHTSACNALTRPYREQLGIVVNAHGLIDDYGQAIDACEYTLRDDVGAEPVAWYPFRVDEYSV